MERIIPKEEFPVFLHERLKEEREKRNLGLREAARDIGVNSSSLSLWENGKRVPNALFLYVIAEYYDEPMSHFIYDPHEITFEELEQEAAETEKLLNEI